MSAVSRRSKEQPECCWGLTEILKPPRGSMHLYHPHVRAAGLRGGRGWDGSFSLWTSSVPEGKLSHPEHTLKLSRQRFGREGVSFFIFPGASRSFKVAGAQRKLIKNRTFKQEVAQTWLHPLIRSEQISHLKWSQRSDIHATSSASSGWGCLIVTLITFKGIKNRTPKAQHNLFLISGKA